MSNNKIDWTKPVQTKENPPRRVTIERTNGYGNFPVRGLIQGRLESECWTLDGRYYGEQVSCLDLENIPTPAWQLQPPPPGRQWHRVDGWTEEMLPQGYRPLLFRESGSYEDSLDGKEWTLGTDEATPAPPSHYCFWRTTRPLPSQPLSPPQPPTPPVLTQRTESILLTPPSEPIFSEATIRIKIDDEAAGEFLMFESFSNDGKLRLDPDEWPAFKAGVEFMLSEIEKHKKL